MPANAVLKVSRVAQGKVACLNLALFDLESGCQSQVVSAPSETDTRAMATEAVGKLLGRLKRGGLQMPGGLGVVAAPAPEPFKAKGPQVSGAALDAGAAADHSGKATGASVAGGEVAAAVGRMIVKVQPKDAVVEVTGPKNFRATGRAVGRNGARGGCAQAAGVARGRGHAGGRPARHRATCGLSRDEGPAGAGRWRSARDVPGDGEP